MEGKGKAKGKEGERNGIDKAERNGKARKGRFKRKIRRLNEKKGEKSNTEWIDSEVKKD